MKSISYICLKFFNFQVVLAALIATLLSLRGLHKKSLSRSGALAAWMVGFLTMATSIRFGVMMIFFYQSSSMLTKYRSEIKCKFEEDHMEGGQRTAVQVLACSLLGTIIAVVHYIYFEREENGIDFQERIFQSQLLCAYLGHYACCNGDTWASELGILSTNSPRLVTSFLMKRVPRGTNGGISLTGTWASIAGGASMGAVHSVVGMLLGRIDQNPLHFTWLPGWAFMVLLGGLCGFLGSLWDSLLGGILQPTWFCEERKIVVKNPSQAEKARGSVLLISGREVLSNEQVNLVSVALTTVMAPAIARRLW